MQVQPLSALVYSTSAEGEDEEERMIEPVKHNLGYKITIFRNDASQLSDSDLSE